MKWYMDFNRPLTSFKNPHFQNEAKCTTFLVKMSFIYFLNVLYFSSDWLCHFKRLFIPVWREIHRSKILPVTSWQLTNRTVIFHAAPDTAYVNHFFPSEFIIWFKSIQAKPVDLQTSSLARSLRDLMHWSSLRSLLRTFERSTCTKSTLLLVLPSLLPEEIKHFPLYSESGF